MTRTGSSQQRSSPRPKERAIIATMVQIGVITMMNIHLYEFDGKIYLQQAGGPIGLRASCAVARVIMNHWDSRWMDAMNENNVERDLEDRYMDDIRVVMMCLKAGWRWHEDELDLAKNGRSRIWQLKRQQKTGAAGSSWTP